MVRPSSVHLFHASGLTTIRHRRVIAIPGLLALLFSPSLYADQLRLANGDVIHGSIQSEDAEQLVIRSDVHGQLTIPMAKVLGITRDTTEPAATDARSQASPSSQSPGPSSFPLVGFLKPDTGRLSVGINDRSGSSDHANYSFESALTWNKGRWEHQWDLQHQLGKSRDRVELNDTSSNYQLNWHYHQTWFANAGVKIDIDDNRGLDERRRFNLGSGVHLINTTATRFYITGGLQYSDEQYNNAIERQGLGWTASSLLTHGFHNSGISIYMKSQINGSFEFDESRDARINTGISFANGRFLTTTIDWTWTFDSDPVAADIRHTRNWKIGVGHAW